MRNLSVENKEAIQRIAGKHSLPVCKIIWNAIINFFKSMFTSNKKIVIKSHCKDSCCCRNCGCIIAYDEKEEDSSSDDIVITDENVKVS